MQIGPYTIAPALVLAPMAGVTDKPFRMLCKQHGAGLCVSEMTHADLALRDTRKSRLRRDHEGEPAPISVQIAGYDPSMLADAARFNVDEGAQIIDINMGCPAKKVCRIDAGSALLRDEPLVARILHQVVRAVDVPVTLKIRTGWDANSRNGLEVARIAEACGVAALAVHGRTRADRFEGHAEYETIAAIKQAVRIPVIANGDVATPAQALAVLRATGADALMLGRAAQGRPWIFREIAQYLADGTLPEEPAPQAIRTVLLHHLDALYAFYGPGAGVRIARKHIGWYCSDRPALRALRVAMQTATCAPTQRALVGEWFEAAEAAYPRTRH